jgi:predicted MPP superfamily phosphohydrolase
MRDRADTALPMRRRLGFGLFLLIYGAVVFFAHLVFALRFVLLPQLPSPWAELAIAVFAAGALLLFVRPVADRLFPERVVARLSWPAFIWMGIAFELLMCLVIGDLVVSLFDRAAWAMGDTAAAPVSDRVEALLVAVVALSLAGWGLLLGLGPPLLRRDEKRIETLPDALDGFRIVQISDVHIGPLLGRRFAARIVARVNELEPDVVAVTGDLVDGRVEHLAADVEPLRDLAPRHGTFFVTGNHDYFSKADPWIAKVTELGFRVLRNERVAIGEGEATFELAGVDDRLARHFGGDHGEDLARALAGRDRERPVVLLAHNPNVFDEAVEQGVDLQLSGHTHGGQIWPFAAFVRLATRYVAGEYTRGRSTLYVSRGTGFWGPPMRLFQPAEITEITLRAERGREP